MASWTDKYVDGKFSIQINTKNGHVVVEIIDLRERRVLEFVVPILYLEKLSRITIMVGNTIFGALLSIKKIARA